MKLRNTFLLLLCSLFITGLIAGCADKTISVTKQDPGQGGKGLSAQEKTEKSGK